MYTHENLQRDKKSFNHDGHYGYDVAWNRYNLDLDWWTQGPGLVDFHSMVAWCIDNCTDDWSMDWNSERAIFEDETDAVAFKLMWF